MPVYIYVYISTFYKNKFLETTQCIEFLSTFEGYIFIYIVCTELKGGGVTIFVIVLKRIASCSPEISVKYIVVYLNQKHPKPPGTGHIPIF